MSVPTFGIEEEFLVCDADTGELRGDAESVLDRARAEVGDDVDHELRTAMIETGTAVCSDANGAAQQLASRRQAVTVAAARVGARILATGSHPWAAPGEIDYVDERRYRRTARRFGPIADESLVCGCHVHVAVPDRHIGVHVLDRIRPWLAPLVALSANSPMWRGADTGYDSWRAQVWARFPTAGPTSLFHTLQRYDKQADALVVSGAAVDRAGLYYDARLSEQWPTVEIRVADVCLDVADAVLIGVLARALVVTAQRAETPPPDVSVELLRASTFMASRWGLSGELVDPVDWRARPAPVVLKNCVDHIAEALEESRERSLVDDGIERLLRVGNGATRQRSATERGGVDAVIDLLAQ